MTPARIAALREYTETEPAGVANVLSECLDAIDSLFVSLDDERKANAAYNYTVKELRQRIEQRDALIARLREERDAAQLQLAQARRPLLPGGRR